MTLNELLKNNNDFKNVYNGLTSTEKKHLYFEEITVSTDDFKKLNTNRRKYYVKNTDGTYTVCRPFVLDPYEVNNPVIVAKVNNKNINLTVKNVVVSDDFIQKSKEDYNNSLKENDYRIGYLAYVPTSSSIAEIVNVITQNGTYKERLNGSRKFPNSMESMMSCLKR